MEVNVTAVWHLSKLLRRGDGGQAVGCIVNMASILGLVGSTPIKQAHYAASKGAVVNLTRELALQWARKGVRVNALCPGWFPSEMTAGMDTDEGSQRFIQDNSPDAADGRGARARRRPAPAGERRQHVHDRQRSWSTAAGPPADALGSVVGWRWAQGRACSSWAATRMRTSSRP